MLAKLGYNALLNSYFVAINYNHLDQYIKIFIQTLIGKKLFFAKNNLITIFSFLKNLNYFNLNNKKHFLFIKFKYISYYTIILRNNVFLTNISF